MMEKAYLNENILLKVISVFCFIFITVALIFIEKNSPATGYEISIYSALPSSVWALLPAAISCAIFIIAHQAFNGDKGNFWLIGFFIIILANFIILSLQFFRGYYIYGGYDPQVHLIYIRSITSTGFISEDCFYPVTHILGAVLIEVCAIPTETVMKYLPVIFTVLFMLFAYLLTSVVSLKKEHAILAAAASSTLLFSYNHLIPYPHALSLFAFPLMFYFYFKSLSTPSLSNKIALIIVLLMFPFFHPVPELVLISCLIIGEVAKFKWVRRIPSQIENFSINHALISFITFFLWISYFTIFGLSIRRVFQWITGEVSVVARADELYPVFGLGPWGFFKLLLKMYGHNLIFITLSVIALGILIRYFSERRSGTRNFFILSLLFLTSSLIYIIIAMSLGLVTWGRILGANAGMWATPVFTSFALYEIFKKPGIPKVIGIVAIVTILFSASTIGVFSVYRSPWIFQPNWQVTQMDICGSNWFNSHKSPVFAYAPMGWYGGHHYIKMPQHFGYPEHESVGEVINKETYIVLTERFKQASASLALKDWMNIDDCLAKPGFNKEDFDRIGEDPNIAKLYSNREFEVLIATPKSQGESSVTT